MLAIVWDNLITNAIKYNQPNGHIFISCTSAGNKIILTFKDTGVGLSEESAKQVFERFYRVDATRKKDGTGLGLSIVKEIVTLLNGTITLESELAKGTTFTVIFLMEGHDESWNKMELRLIRYAALFGILGTYLGSKMSGEMDYSFVRSTPTFYWSAGCRYLLGNLLQGIQSKI